MVPLTRAELEDIRGRKERHPSAQTMSGRRESGATDVEQSADRRQAGSVVGACTPTHAIIAARAGLPSSDRGAWNHRFLWRPVIASGLGAMTGPTSTRLGRRCAVMGRMPPAAGRARTHDRRWHLSRVPIHWAVVAHVMSSRLRGSGYQGRHWNDGALGTSVASTRGMVRSVVLMVVLLAGASAPSLALAESVAEHCPGYAVQLQLARDSLAQGNRARAIGALHEAQTALAECIRQNSELSGQEVLLAASSVSADQYGFNDLRRTRSTSDEGTFCPASS